MFRRLAIQHSSCGGFRKRMEMEKKEMEGKCGLYTRGMLSMGVVNRTTKNTSQMY